MRRRRRRRRLARSTDGAAEGEVRGGVLTSKSTRDLMFIKRNSGARDAAQTGHKRQATKTGRHVVTQGSLGGGGEI